MGVFPGLCALYLVQDLVALVDAGSKLLLASKAGRVVQIADHPSVPQMQLRREIKLDAHSKETAAVIRSSAVGLS
jgi:hypothetical protein